MTAPPPEGPRPEGVGVRPMRETAEAMVRRVLLAALPPGAEPSFLAISAAWFEGSGRRRKAVGLLLMFDGLPATVEVAQAGTMGGYPVWSHRWREMAGGACSLETDGWRRCDDAGNLLPRQPDLFGLANPITCTALPVSPGERP